jgi:outer membrane lipoprotein-sorting protein
MIQESMMKKMLLAVAVGSTLIAAHASATSMKDRLAAMEKRTAYLEQRVQSQDQAINTTGDNWFDKIELSR